MLSDIGLLKEIKDLGLYQNTVKVFFKLDWSFDKNGSCEHRYTC